MLFKVNCKGLVNKLSSFLSFKINRLAKKFVPNEIKKVNKINDLAARGPLQGPKGPAVKILTTALAVVRKMTIPFLGCYSRHEKLPIIC